MEYKKLGDIATYINGYAFKPEQRGSEGLPIIRIQDLTGNAYDLGYYNGDYPKKVELNNGDVLISWSASLGVYLWDRGKALLNQHIFKVVFDKIEIDKFYFMYAVEYNLDKMSLKTHGATMKHITKKDFDNVVIPYPDLDYQKEVAYRLTSLKGIIKKYQEQLDLLDELIKARFVEMFGEYEASVKLSRYIKELRAGKSLAGKTKCKNKVLKTGAATFGFFDKEQYKYYPVEYVPNPLHKVEDGDVIISRMNTPELVGSCSYVFEAPDDMYYPDRLWKTIITEDTNPIFLWQLMWQQDIRKQIKENSFGTSGTMNNISKVKLLNIKAIDVPLELQNQFASFVQEIDKSRSRIQKSLEASQELFDSLMQEYFG